MMKTLVFLLFSFASLGAGQDTSCASKAVTDGGDDQCQLLQAGVGVVSAHGKDAADKKITSKSAPTSKATGLAQKQEKKEKEEQLPDWLTDGVQKLTDAVGASAGLEDDMANIKDKADKFTAQVHTSVATLASGVSNPGKEQSAAEIGSEVQAACYTVHAAAAELAAAVKKASDDFMKGIAGQLPEAIRDVLSQGLTSVEASSSAFAEAFLEAADTTKQKLGNFSEECAVVQAGIDKMENKTRAVVQSATGMTLKEMSEEFKKAKEQLPDTIKVEIDKLIEKVQAAGDHIMKITEPVQEFAGGIVTAYHKICPGLKGAAGRLEVGILTSFMVLAWSLLM